MKRWAWGMVLAAVLMAVGAAGCETDEAGIIMTEYRLPQGKDGMDRILRIRMAHGTIDRTDRGGESIETGSGQFLLEVTDAEGRLVSQLDLNERFGQEILSFDRNFKLVSDDYNDDSVPDFAIGRPLNPGISEYRLFTFQDEEGLVELEVQESAEAGIVQDGEELSIRLDRIEGGFVGTWTEPEQSEPDKTYYIWKDGVFEPYKNEDEAYREGMLVRLEQNSIPHWEAAYPETNKRLHLGHHQEQVKEIFGEPSFRELVRDPTGVSLHAEVWRYESDQAQMTVTWSEEQTVSEYMIAYPMNTDISRTQIYKVNSYLQDYTTETKLPLIPTLSPEMEWNFESELPFNYLIGKAGKTLLVLGDDGWISGYHDDTTLYGIHEETGDVMWKAEGKYAGVQYAISEDRRHVAVMTQLNPETMEHEIRLRYLDSETGQLLWEKKWAESDAWLSGAQGVLAVGLGNPDKEWTLLGLKETNGERLWTRTMSPQERMYSDSFAKPVILVGLDQEMTAYDPWTGKFVWSRKRDAEPYRSYTFTHPAIDKVSADYRNMQASEKEERWFQIEDQYELIDLATGQTQASVPYDKGTYISLVNSDSMLIHRSDDAIFWRGEGFGTVWHDISDNKPRWETEGKLITGTLDGDILYGYINDRLTAVNRSSGEIIWTASYTWKDMNLGVDGVPYPNKRPILYQNYLVLPAEGSVYLASKETGELLGRIEGAIVTSAEGRELQTAYGMADSHAGKLWLGSANGTFRSVKIK
ncbi:PQQ-binding-like beta-propeller repeat protein [Paenibacillus sp. J2TS4]|uniref:outer membrane protein assembly factor BamB family protein n=1 Tax=Paenibacillus sp. J2TS4 TaxID=2807194 RepID=UPI001B12962A|nr:PQQ-binding-like beta-propeller repeat protein [Paenibacillus sp. J2TS4]GIP35267.1 hypothetical protein J2TS4_44770 [Paenibacillus sp. J2TS4]